MDVFEFHEKLHETLGVLKEYGIERITEDNLGRVKKVLRHEDRVDGFVKEVIKNLRRDAKYKYTAILDFLKRKLGVERFDKEGIEKLAEYVEKGSYSLVANEIKEELGQHMSRAVIRKICKVILGDFYFISKPQEHPNITLKKGKIPFVVLAVLQEIPDELEKVWDRKRVEMSAWGREIPSKKPQAAKEKRRKKRVYNIPLIKYLHKHPEREKIINSLPKSNRVSVRRTVELNEEIEKACKILGLDPDNFLVDKVLHLPIKREKAFARVLLEAGEDKATLLMEKGVDQRLVRRAVELLEKVPDPKRILKDFQKNRKSRRPKLDADDLIRRLDYICESLGVEKKAVALPNVSDSKHREVIGRVAYILKQFENEEDVAKYLMNKGVPKEVVETGLKIARKEVF